MSNADPTTLPKGWLRVSISDVANAASGHGFPTNLQGRTSGEVPFAKVSDISRTVEEGGRYLNGAANYISGDDAKALRASALPPDTIVFAKIGGAIELNRRVILACNTIVDNNVMGISPEPGLEPLYLYYFMLTQRLGALSRATTVPSLRRGDIDGISFPLPPSAEQRRITEALDEIYSDLDAGFTALERVRGNLKLYRASVLKAAVEGALTAEWRARHPDTEPASELLERLLVERRHRWEEQQAAKFKEKCQEPPKDWKVKYKQPFKLDVTNLPSLPERWAWCNGDTLFSFITSGSRGWARYSAEDGPVFIRMGNLDHGTIRLDMRDTQHVNPPVGTEGVRTKIVPGDILISITADVGMVALAQDDIEDAYINQHVALARPVPSTVAAFLAWYLASPSGGGRQFKDLQRGATKVGLGLDDIRSIAIPLPPLSEQEAIVEAVEAQLSVIDHVEADLDTRILSVQSLRQAILRQAFSGTLVPQDPLDEPASELLKRIAAERGAREREVATVKQVVKRTNGSPTAKRGRTKKSKTKEN